MYSCRSPRHKVHKVLTIGCFQLDALTTAVIKRRFLKYSSCPRPKSQTAVFWKGHTLLFGLIKGGVFFTFTGQLSRESSVREKWWYIWIQYVNRCTSIFHHRLPCAEKCMQYWENQPPRPPQIQTICGSQVVIFLILILTVLNAGIIAQEQWWITCEQHKYAVHCLQPVLF